MTFTKRSKDLGAFHRHLNNDEAWVDAPCSPFPFLVPSSCAEELSANDQHSDTEIGKCFCMRVAKELTKTNLADLFTKPLSRLHCERLLTCTVWGSSAHEERLTGRKRKHINDGAASCVSFPVKGAGTSWVGARHQGC